MMRSAKKPLKFYIIIFVFSVVLVLGYTIYMLVFKDAMVSDLYALWFMPFLFTGFYYGSDILLDKFLNRKKKVDYESKFLDAISIRMRESGEFIVEEFRRLQNDQVFQKELKKAYYIYQNGESEVFSIDRLEKKYRKDSLEKRAMRFVIEYLRENKQIPESDYENESK